MQNLPRWVHTVLHYMAYLIQRSRHDRLTVNAGYMAYITLLSLVPLSTVLLTGLSRVPAFEASVEVIQQFVFSNFVPTAGETIQNTLNQFIANTAKMTTFGLIFLLVTALLLISAIDKNLNYIWRIQKKRPTIYSFSLYWMVLTLGPLLLGASLALSSYLTSAIFFSKETVHLVYRVLPVLFSFLTFLGLYLFVPNRKVRLSHAFVGALVAGSLFEVSKKCFALYVTFFPTHQLIYGALAAVPLLFMWIYLCWMIVLAGAEITASLGEEKEWRVSEPFSADWLSFYEKKLNRRRKHSDSSDSTSE